MLLLKLPKNYTVKWLSEQFKRYIASFVFENFPFEELYPREVIGLIIDNQILCVGNLQSYSRIRNTKYFRVYVHHLIGFHPIKHVMRENYTHMKFHLDREDLIIKIGKEERKVHKIHAKFVFDIYK